MAKAIEANRQDADAPVEETSSLQQREAIAWMIFGIAWDSLLGFLKMGPRMSQDILNQPVLSSF